MVDDFPKNESNAKKSNKKQVETYLSNLRMVKDKILTQSDKTFKRENRNLKRKLKIQVYGSGIRSLKDNPFFKEAKAINEESASVDLIKIKKRFGGREIQRC